MCALPPLPAADCVPVVGVALSAEPAARRTFASFSAVHSIDGVAEGMLTQHEFSPFPALSLSLYRPLAFLFKPFQPRLQMSETCPAS